MSSDPVKRSVYWCYKAMKNRCLNASHISFPNYGGRGIKICQRWLDSFNDFVADIGPRPSQIHCLERINNDGDYEPSNCRWATRSEQGFNKRTNRFITAFGETKAITQWISDSRCLVTIKTLRRNLMDGMEPEKAITTHKSRKYIEFNGVRLTQKEWADRLGISDTVLCQRFSYGWSIERALTTPITRKR